MDNTRYGVIITDRQGILLSRVRNLTLDDMVSQIVSYLKSGNIDVNPMEIRNGIINKPMARITKPSWPVSLLVITHDALDDSTLPEKQKGKGKTSWIDHVKATQAKHRCSYKDAMVIAKQTWH